jgi:hypothetical protein
VHFLEWVRLRAAAEAESVRPLDGIAP